MDWKRLEPNEHGDWINHRNESFKSFIPLETEKRGLMKSQSWFVIQSCGLATSRDAWCYNSSYGIVQKNIQRSIAFFNQQSNDYQIARKENNQLEVTDFIDTDSTKFSWDRQQRKDVQTGKQYQYNNTSLREGMYRPFFKQYVYFNRTLNNCVYQLPTLFPDNTHPALAIYITGAGASKGFSSLITDVLPNYHTLDTGQCFPLYWYDESTSDIADLFNQASDEEVMDRYIRRDGVSDWILRECRQRYGNKVSKEDIFYYVYGILHSPEYRTTFEADLKKMLPRLPLVDTPDMFMAFSKAGRDLAELHLNYETVQPYEGVSIKTIGTPTYEVVKMRFGKKDSKTADKSTIIYNNNITIESIPLEAYDYVVNGKSALEWIMERYQITTDAKSGITNNPNDWSKEHGDEKYIFNLVLRIITVSLETMKIVNALPKLKFE